MRTVLAVELLKLTRSPLVRTATVVLGLVVPLFALGVVAVAESDGDSQLALKVRPMITGEGWSALLGTTGQILSVAALIAAGFVVSWCFGREFTDGTLESLLTSLPARAAIASGKIAACMLWAVLVNVVAVAVALGLGVFLRLDGGPLPEAARALAAGVLASLLAIPFAVLVTATRDALAGAGAIIGTVVVTQLSTLVGAAAWFPYAAPSLWLGLGGPDVRVSTFQLLLVLPVAAVGWAATAWWWQRAELVSR